MSNASTIASNITKLGLLAGAGDLPVLIVQICEQAKIPLYVSELCDTSLDIADIESDKYGLGEVGKRVKALKNSGVSHIVIAGYVSRPNFSALKLDWAGTKILPNVISEARKGDDSLLAFLVKYLEGEGFQVIGAEAILDKHIIADKIYTKKHPRKKDLSDIEKAIHIAQICGGLDIGQAIVIADGLVLAVEAQEGTDLMLERVAKLPGNIRGRPGERKGVLVKRTKPQQEKRVDLPVVGLKTIERAVEAQLCGIVLQAENGFFLDQSKSINLADQNQVFLMGRPMD